MKIWLVTIAVLLCSMGMSAATYSDWTSTNKGQSNTTSSNSYTITANAGDLLTFDWLVSSESQYDKFIITIGGTEILNKSGELSGTYQHTFTSSGTYTMEVKYTKDGSVDRGSDYAMIYNITFNRGNSGTCGANLTWELTNEGELIIEGTGEMTSCPWDGNYESEIKTVIIGEGVTSIRNFAFEDCSSLTTVIIPENSQLTSIGGAAFSGCSSLPSINIPEGVTSIGSSAFYECSSLTTVIIPENSQLTSIGSSAFEDCSSLTAINIPEGVTSIGNWAFEDCSSLTSITIPESVTSIGHVAFSGCGNLTSIIVEEGNLVYDSRNNCNAIIETETNKLIRGCQSTIIPESVTSIGDRAFSSCSSLTAITIPNSVTSIEYYAFEDCSSLTAITIPKSVTSIDGSAFYGCNNLISFVVEEGNLVYDSRNNCNAIIETETNKLIRGFQTTIIPNSVTSIGRTAFNGCTELTDITIPEGVTSIGDNAFTGCKNLTRITIPGSMTRIESSAFHNTNLPIENDIRYADTWAVEVVDDTKDNYTLRNNTTGIADGTFYYCRSLTAIDIPESVTSIGRYAFSGCSSLTTITIPEGVTSIGWSAFSGCSSLTTINIPESVTSIGESAFSNTNLPVENNIRYAGTWVVGVTDNTKDKYTLRDNTTGIADYMFQDCSMTEITLPNNLKYIGNYVCVGCSNLTSLTIPNSVTSIGEAAFVQCWRVTSITIPSNVTSIGGRAFTGRGDGTSIVVDANNTVYDSRGNCNAIICTETNHLIVGCSTTIIPNSVTSIGEFAFMSCGITSVIIPNGVTCIKYGTFAGSGLLTSISIPSSVTDIERDAFASCRSLKTIICRNVVPPTCEANAFRDVDMGACALEVPLNSVATYRETSPWSGFNISAIVPQTLVLNDGEVFENEENMVVEEITYIRNFKNTNWQALYVPFEIPYENIKDDFAVAYINDVHQFDDDDDGTIDRTRVEAIKVTGGVLKANYPYMIRAKVAGEKTITVTDATLYAAEENSIDCSSVFDTYTFTGTYSKIPAAELPKEEGYYALSGGSWKQFSSGATSSLGAFRIYMKIDSRHANATVEARAIEMRVIGDDEEETTGVENMVPTVNGQQSTLIYDLQGRRVEHPVKGLYIVNGEKVWIK